MKVLLIFIVLLIALSCTLVYLNYLLFKKLERKESDNKIISDELIKEKTKRMLIWKITKPSDDVIMSILWQEEVCDTIISFIEYKIAVKTDSIRSIERTEEKIWRVNELHELLAYFDKVKREAPNLMKKIKEREEKKNIWQWLV